MEMETNSIAEIILKRKYSAEDSHFLISKLTTKLQESRQWSTGIKTDMSTNERALSLETMPYIYDQLFFDKSIKAIYNK